MPAEILDGAAIASGIISELQADIDALTKAGAPPRLVAVRANDNGGSASYAKAQKSWCAEHGVEYVLEDLGPDASRDDILSCIRTHNETPETSAIMVHMPVPPAVDDAELTAAIAPEKDAEGMHPQNLGRLLFGETLPGPCTALGAVELVKHAMPDLSGATAVVVGRSQIVGRPAALLLVSLHSTVTVVHTRTRNLEDVVRNSDIVIAATGAPAVMWRRYKEALGIYKQGEGDRPELTEFQPIITADMIKPGAVVVDVGVNRVPVALDEKTGEPLRDTDTGKIRMKTIGDVDYENVKEVAGFITTPKGGSGPMTNAMLLRNTVHAAKNAANSSS